MKILLIGTDVTMFEKRTASRARLEEYARLFDEYHMIIYTARGFKTEIAPPLFIYPTNSRFYFLRPFDAFRIGKKVIQERGIKLVSVQDPAESGLAGWLLKKTHGVKLHIQIHGDFLPPFFRKNSWKERGRYFLAKFILPRGDSFRVVSQRIKHSLISNFKFLISKPIIVLPIFVDRERIAEVRPSFDLHKKYPQFDFAILMVSRLFREKNIGLALESFHEFIKEFPQAGLVIVGDGPERRNLESRIRNLELMKNVRLEGWQSDLVSYYKTADLYLLTSNFEGYGRSVIEAAAAGCPVVMTDVGVAGEIIRNGDTGMVAQPQDKSALISALRNARTNYANMHEMAERAQKEVLELSPRTQLEYLKYYQESFQFEKT